VKDIQIWKLFKIILSQNYINNIFSTPQVVRWSHYKGDGKNAWRLTMLKSLK